MVSLPGAMKFSFKIRIFKMFKVNVYYNQPHNKPVLKSNYCAMHSKAHNGHVWEAHKQTQLSESPARFPGVAFIYLVS